MAFRLPSCKTHGKFSNQQGMTFSGMLILGTERATLPTAWDGMRLSGCTGPSSGAQEGISCCCGQGAGAGRARDRRTHLGVLTAQSSSCPQPPWVFLTALQPGQSAPAAAAQHVGGKQGCVSGGRDSALSRIQDSPAQHLSQGLERRLRERRSQWIKKECKTTAWATRT